MPDPNNPSSGPDYSKDKLQNMNPKEVLQLFLPTLKQNTEVLSHLDTNELNNLHNMCKEYALLQNKSFDIFSVSMKSDEAKRNLKRQLAEAPPLPSFGRVPEHLQDLMRQRETLVLTLIHAIPDDETFDGLLPPDKPKSIYDKVMRATTGEGSSIQKIIGRIEERAESGIKQSYGPSAGELQRINEYIDTLNMVIEHNMGLDPAQIEKWPATIESLKLWREKAELLKSINPPFVERAQAMANMPPSVLGKPIRLLVGMIASLLAIMSAVIIAKKINRGEEVPATDWALLGAYGGLAGWSLGLFRGSPDQAVRLGNNMVNMLTSDAFLVAARKVDYMELSRSMKSIGELLVDNREEMQKFLSEHQGGIKEEDLIQKLNALGLKDTASLTSLRDPDLSDGDRHAILSTLLKAEIKTDGQAEEVASAIIALGLKDYVVTGFGESQPAPAPQSGGVPMKNPK